MILCIKKYFFFPVMALTVLTVPVTAGEKFTETDTLNKTLRYSDSSRPKMLTVDNIFGSITVSAHQAETVTATVYKTIAADSASRLQAAKVEVSLDIFEQDNHLHFYVSSPLRDQDGNWRQKQDLGYRVQYDFQLVVPTRLAMMLKTVNSGDVLVNGTNGRFEINNVNGKIDLEDIAGDGKALTVNGSVTAHFLEAPQGDLKLRTVNGNLDVSFPPEFSADLQVKTFNGEVYSGFDVTSLPSGPPTYESEKGMKRYKSDAFTNLRVSGGGPKCTFETLNGDILIRKK